MLDKKTDSPQTYLECEFLSRFPLEDLDDPAINTLSEYRACDLVVIRNCVFLDHKGGPDMKLHVLLLKSLLLLWVRKYRRVRHHCEWREETRR